MLESRRESPILRHSPQPKAADLQSKRRSVDMQGESLLPFQCTSRDEIYYETIFM